MKLIPIDSMRLKIQDSEHYEKRVPVILVNRGTLVTPDRVLWCFSVEQVRHVLSHLRQNYPELNPTSYLPAYGRKYTQDEKYRLRFLMMDLTNLNKPIKSLLDELEDIIDTSCTYATTL